MSYRTIKPNDSANFTPELSDYKTLQPFRYWCQKVLPLVYDDSLSYYEMLCKVVDYLNKTMEDVETLNTDVNALHEAYEKLQNYVNSYFDTLDVQEEINNKLDDLVKDGTLTNLISTYIDPLIDKQNSKITVLEERMNTFTSLPDGSTSGNAELADIRVPSLGFNNNKPYPTAGEAVRGQIGELNGNIFNSIMLNASNIFHISGKGWINNTDGKFYDTYGYNYKKYYVQNIKLFIINNIDIQGSIVSAINFFDKNNKYIKHELDGIDSLKTYKNVIINVPINAYYCYVIYNNTCDIGVCFSQDARNNYFFNALLNNFTPEIGVENGSGWINKSNGHLETQPAYSYKYMKVKYDNNKSYLIKHANLSGNAVALINYYDENDTFLAYNYDSESSENIEYNNIEIYPPSNTDYFIICYIGDFSILKSVTNSNDITYWSDKTILWLGTSIPATPYEGGKTYPEIVGSKIGAKIINNSISGSFVRKIFNPDNINTEKKYRWIWDLLSVITTNEEVDKLVENWDNYRQYFDDAPTVIDEETKKRLKNCSYQTIIDPYINNVDLIVFDYGRNDLFDMFNNDDNEFNKNTFVGAMNWLIRHIYETNPRARICMISHYENQEYPTIVEAQENVSKYWSIPLFRLDKILGWSNKQIQTNHKWDNGIYTNTSELNTTTIKNAWCEDRLHPNTDKSGGAIKLIANAITPWIKTIV